MAWLQLSTVAARLLLQAAQPGGAAIQLIGRPRAQEYDK
jgi:hypothetical protein